jgi:hypothetical protein
MKIAAYVERALFVIGHQNSGKSTQLRSMFLDRRLGTAGAVPTAKNVQNAFAISNERWLYLRLTSPHEAGETLKQFLKKCADEMQSYGSIRRWNFAGALQPTGTSKLADAPDVISGFVTRFTPDRIRAIILRPDRSGSWMLQSDLKSLVSNCRKIPGTEVVVVDATSRTASGLFYADFFDFT